MDVGDAGREPCNMDEEPGEDDAAPPWPDENPPTLVARVVRDIDSRSQAEHDVLLADLLCAAWPAARAQMQ